MSSSDPFETYDELRLPCKRRSPYGGGADAVGRSVHGVHSTSNAFEITAAGRLNSVPAIRLLARVNTASAIDHALTAALAVAFPAATAGWHTEEAACLRLAIGGDAENEESADCGPIIDGGGECALETALLHSDLAVVRYGARVFSRLANIVPSNLGKMFRGEDLKLLPAVRRAVDTKDVDVARCVLVGFNDLMADDCHGDPHCAAVLLDTGAVAVAIAAFEVAHGHSFYARSACRYLLQLARYIFRHSDGRSSMQRSGIRALVSAGAGQVAVAACNRYQDAPTVIARAVSLLYVLACVNDEPSGRLLADDGACETLVVVLREYEGDEAMAANICDAMDELAQSCSDAAQRLVESGAVQVLAGVLSRRPIADFAETEDWQHDCAITAVRVLQTLIDASSPAAAAPLSAGTPSQSGRQAFTFAVSRFTCVAKPLVAWLHCPAGAFLPEWNDVDDVVTSSLSSAIAVLARLACDRGLHDALEAANVDEVVVHILSGRSWQPLVLADDVHRAFSILKRLSESGDAAAAVRRCERLCDLGAADAALSWLEDHMSASTDDPTCWGDPSGAELSCLHLAFNLASPKLHHAVRLQAFPWANERWHSVLSKYLASADTSLESKSWAAAVHGRIHCGVSDSLLGSLSGTTLANSLIKTLDGGLQSAMRDSASVAVTAAARARPGAGVGAAPAQGATQTAAEAATRCAAALRDLCGQQSPGMCLFLMSCGAGQVLVRSLYASSAAHPALAVAVLEAVAVISEHAHARPRLLSNGAETAVLTCLGRHLNDPVACTAACDALACLMLAQSSSSTGRALARKAALHANTLIAMMMQVCRRHSGHHLVTAAALRALAYAVLGAAVNAPSAEACHFQAAIAHPLDGERASVLQQFAVACIRREDCSPDVLSRGFLLLELARPMSLSSASDHAAAAAAAVDAATACAERCTSILLDPELQKLPCVDLSQVANAAALMAAARGDAAALQQLSGPSTAPSIQWNIAIQIATARGHAAALDAMLERCASVEELARDAESALCISIAHDDAALTHHLLAKWKPSVPLWSTAPKPHQLPFMPVWVAVELSRVDVLRHIHHVLDHDVQQRQSARSSSAAAGAQRLRLGRNGGGLAADLRLLTQLACTSSLSDDEVADAGAGRVALLQAVLQIVETLGSESPASSRLTGEAPTAPESDASAGEVQAGDGAATEAMRSLIAAAATSRSSALCRAQALEALLEALLEDPRVDASLHGADWVLGQTMGDAEDESFVYAQLEAILGTSVHRVFLRQPCVLRAFNLQHGELLPIPHQPAQFTANDASAMAAAAWRRRRGAVLGWLTSP